MRVVGVRALGILVLCDVTSFSTLGNLCLQEEKVGQAELDF